MKVDFSKSTPSTPVVEVQTVATPVEGVSVDSVNTHVPTPEVSVPTTTRPGGAGDFIKADHLPGFRDIILPRINIVQSIGDLKESFDPGQIVFNQSLVLFSPPVVDKPTGNIKVPASAPVNISIIGFRPTRFVERVQGGVKGMTVNTEAEVRSAGGTTDYNEWKLKEKSGIKRFEPLAEAFIAIRRPATCVDDDSVFTYAVGDNDKYALALWGMRGTAYTHAAKKVFFTARQMGCLAKSGYPSWSYSLSTRTQTTNGNTYFIPVAIPDKANSPAFMEFVRALLSAPTVASSEE